MAGRNLRTHYWKGVRDAAPFLLVIVPFAMLFGVLASEAGLNVAEALDTPLRSTHLWSPAPLHRWQPAWQPMHTPLALA